MRATTDTRNHPTTSRHSMRRNQKTSTANALSNKERALMDAYWRAANYLSVGQICYHSSRAASRAWGWCTRTRPGPYQGQHSHSGSTSTREWNLTRMAHASGQTGLILLTSPSSPSTRTASDPHPGRLATRRSYVFALQTPQRAYLVALHWVDTRRAVLRPADV